MNDFVYHIPTKVYFGKDELQHLGEELAACGKNVLLCYGGGSIKKTGLYDKVLAQAAAAGLTVHELSGIDPNPRVTSVNAGAALCKKENIDVVLAIGGGSVIDCAKFVAAAALLDVDAWDIVTGKVKAEKALPLVTVLTLAATGSEMDDGGVISNLETQQKLANAAPCMRPKVSFLDPTLTYTVSAYQTACGSADILSHIFEVYFNMNADFYMQDCIMEGLMKTVIKYAPVALAQPNNYEARANLMWASSWAINGFIENGRSQAWSCHAMEHELSAFYDITHGLGLAILTPRWMAYTLNEATAPKFRQYAVNVWGVDAALPAMEAAQQGIAKTAEFLGATLGLKTTLTEIGIDDKNLAVMAQHACRGGVLPAFQPLGAADVEAIYKMCL